MPKKKIEVCWLHLLHFPGLTTIFSTIRRSTPNETHLPRTVVQNCGLLIWEEPRRHKITFSGYVISLKCWIEAQCLGRRLTYGSNKGVFTRD